MHSLPVTLLFRPTAYGRQKPRLLVPTLLGVLYRTEVKRLDVATLAVSALSVISVGLASKGGLALVVDPVSGDKQCMDRLAAFLGVQSGCTAANVALILSELWIVLLPLALVGASIIFARARRPPKRSKFDSR